MNNKKYHTLEFKQKQSLKNDRLFGPVLQHEKTCIACNKKFFWKGRLLTKGYAQAKFCSRSCSNNRKTWWDKPNNKYRSKHYREIAKSHHEFKCVVCGFDKIIAIHHVDHNKKNNSPENLIPLCPNHHEMVHSKWRFEVQPVIDKWVENYKVDSSNK